LLQELSLHGYGWLRPEGVVRKLNALAAARAERGPVPSTQGFAPRLGLDMAEQPTGMHCFCCGKRFGVEVLNSSGFCPECQGYTERKRDVEEPASWWKKLSGRQTRP
jgi:hypothetical protein